MEKIEFLNKVQYYKNAIDEYSGPDPLEPRYEYIRWLDSTVGKENFDLTSPLEKTLQKFQNDARYTNDPRFVHLLIIFSRLKGDKASYFKQLYEHKLGSKCSALYKAWSEELVSKRCYQEAYRVLNQAIYESAEPISIVFNAQRELESYIGRKVLGGSRGCELLKVPCLCYKQEIQNEVAEVKNWEMNPVKTGESENFECPLYVPEPDDPNKRRMYCKSLVYPTGTGKELQLEEIMAIKYYQKLASASSSASTSCSAGSAKREESVAKLKREVSTPCVSSLTSTALTQDSLQVSMNNLSCGTQSFTVNTKAALKIVGSMWNSTVQPVEPESGGFVVREDSVREDSLRARGGGAVVESCVKAAPPSTRFSVFSDSVQEDQENQGTFPMPSTSVSTRSSKPPTLSLRKPTQQPQREGGEPLVVGSEQLHRGKHLVFGGGGGTGGALHQAEEDNKAEDNLAVCLDPTVRPDLNNKPPVSAVWKEEDEDVTCNTKVFNNFVAFASTPNMKAKESCGSAAPPPPAPAAAPLVAQPLPLHASANPRDPGQVSRLSAILEASKETQNSGCSNSENRPPNILDLSKSFDKMELKTDNPFCSKVTESLLRVIDFPNNFDSHVLKNYHTINSRLPTITKTLKLGDEIYSLTGESFKGSYAKVVRVTNKDRPYALKIEKPACHWEYYIVKEIRNRIDPDKAVYFCDIDRAFIYQNGSIFISDFAKYGTLLNVITQYKLSGSNVNWNVWTLFCMEVLSAVHYLNTQCNIIHADIKPDNFVVHSLPVEGRSGPFVQLIDFGRAIDMNLMPKGAEFTHVVTTDGFQCNEMKENKPWNFHIDIYGLAGTIYCILVGDYMKVISKNNVYVLSRTLPRVHQRLWNPIFQSLLNIESSGRLPDLMHFHQLLRTNCDSYEPSSVRSWFTTLYNILNGN